MRVAFLSPLPPAPTGIADYAADVLALLAGGEHEIDVFHSQETVDRSRLPAELDVQPASAFAGRQGKRPYDAAVYQMGNGPSSAFLYEHLSRVPGLLVLHDLVLHHSRAAQFLEADAVRAWRSNPASSAAREAAEPWLERWRAELAYTYPDSAPRLYEAQLGTTGQLLPYAYPLLRIPVEASRLVGVHSTAAGEAVQAEVPGAAVANLVMPAAAARVDRGAVRERRRQLGFGDEDMVVGCFGLLTAEKRIETVARAVVRAAASDPRIRLLLVGPVPESSPASQQLERLRADGVGVLTGRVPFGEIPLYVEAADIVVHLRYPTARETSAALLRVLAQGRATIIADLQHQAGIPADAVLRADMVAEEDDVTRGISTLAADPERRNELGRRAAAFVRQVHSAERARESWLQALEKTRGQSAPAPGDWPAHWPRP